MTIKTIVITTPLVMLSWFATLSLVAFATDDAPAYLVLFPSERFLGSLPDDAALVSETALSITVTSGQARFASELYAHGAWIVLPAGLRGCSPT